MSLAVLLLLAIGLCGDSFAVSLGSGLSARSFRYHDAFILAFVLALFQGIMPVAGYFLGMKFRHLIADLDHWAAFILLSLLGLRMIYESLKKFQPKNKIDTSNLLLLAGMGIATSIDALILGITFAFLKVNIVYAASIIFLVTLIASFAGFWIGAKAGTKFRFRVEWIGGVILIIIGLKILIQHLYLN